MSNVWVLSPDIKHHTDYQPHANLQKFANDFGGMPEKDSCEKSPSETAILLGAKILNFRKSHKPFGKNVTFAKN